MDILEIGRIKENILELAEHSNANIRRVVAIAIREFDLKDGTTTILNKYLIDKQWTVRYEAAKTIKYHFGNKESAVNFIAKRLDVGYDKLRPTILSILAGNVKTEKEKEGDIAKKETVAEVKKELAISAAWIDKSLILNPLLGYLDSTNPQHRTAGLVGLGNIGNPESLKKIEEIAQKDEELTVRKSAVVAIGKIKSSQSFEILKTLVEDKHDDIRREAVIAINHIKPENADEILIKSIFDSSPRVREVACIALGNLKNKEHLPYIIKLLDDKQPNVRKAAANVLSNLREINALPYVLKKITDSNEFVQNEAALAYIRFPRITGKIDMENFLIDFEEPKEELKKPETQEPKELNPENENNK